VPFTPPGPYTPANFVQFAQDNALPPVQSTEIAYPRPATIDGLRWCKAYPYQLIVVERADDNTYVPKTASGGTSWTFNLPIPPESLRISMPFAIKANVTLGGVVEEHGGAPIRMIHISGTTGVLFGRNNAPSPISDFGPNIFGGTLAAASATATAAQLIGSTQNTILNTVSDTEFTPGADLETLTGYYQMRLWTLFLEAYLQLKKTKEGRKARLAFTTWKEEAVWLVVPTGEFVVSKSSRNAFKYDYDLSLKAYKRIQIGSGNAGQILDYIPVQKDPSKLASLLRTVSQVRAVVQNASATIAAVGGDVHNGLYEPMRELTLFAKDALSVPLAVADMPDSIVQALKPAILDLMSAPGAATRIFTSGITAVKDAVDDLLDLSAEQTGDPASLQSRDAHPANDPFLVPSDNYNLFNGVNIGDLRLQPKATVAIANERTRARRMTGLDFQKRHDAVDATSTLFANAIGLGSDTFNETYGISSTPTVLEKPTDEDFDVLCSLSQLQIEFERLIVNTDNDLNPKLDAIAAVAGLAARSGIAFTTPKSKFAVPFPYGSTIEMLASRYLGDPLRWHEIVALNGLQSPYVDEEGFELALLINGADDTVMVSDTSYLGIGQPVWISSRGTARTCRRITRIVHLSPTQHLVTVDGLPNMNLYTVLAGATLQGFLPNTVNSQQIIYIPSDQDPQSNEDFRTKTIVGVDSYDPLLAIGGIDFLLTPKNDLVVTPDGDNRWAVGLTNIVQKVRIALSTRRGTLLGHPQYGLPLAPGMSVADLSATDISRATQDLFNGDPTFNGVKAAKVTISGPVAQLGIAVSIAATSQTIPIGLEVSTGIRPQSS
jgi:hypothetical protein